MKWAILACVGSVVVVAASAHAAPASAHSAAFIISAPAQTDRAPADVYFGLYRLSSLSVRNAIYDMTVEGDSPLALPGQVERIAAVQSALGEWAQRYPRDPWLTKAMFDFATLLRGKNVPRYNRIAFALLEELQDSYGATGEGQLARSALASFTLQPEFDLASGPVVRPMGFIFASQPAAIGENRRHRFL